jgi:hypothetical protein
MDHVAAAKKNKGDQVAPPRPSSVTAEAAVMKKKPTTLLDAFEVECIPRELEKLVATTGRAPWARVAKRRRRRATTRTDTTTVTTASAVRRR